MSLLEFLKQNWSEIFALTREHLFLVFVSTALAVLIGVPLGILLTRKKSLQTPVLGVANILQTVPSLALFGLLIPIAYIGGIGARTAIIALTVYSFLPIIRNTVTGISGVDAKIKEAATAMGMTDFQILRMVELPLAAPVILTGIRVAVVIAVGVATIAAAVGAGGLGTYIFRGLRQNDNNLLLAGAIFSALLALFADFALGQIGKIYRLKNLRNETLVNRRKFIAVGAAILIALIFAVPFIANLGSANSNSKQTIRVGSKDFTESIILAEILAQMLEKRGITVERQLELGGNLAHDALVSNNLDVYPEYTGTAYTAILKHQPMSDTEKVYRQTKDEYAEKFDLILSPPLGFSNDFAILVRGETAQKNNLKTISDAVPVAENWQAGFGQDFMSRADGYVGFARTYNFNFAKQPREMDLSLTYRALKSGELDIIAGNSTDGLISALDLFQLADDKHYFPPYQAVFIAREDKIKILRQTFDELENAISTDEMRQLNYSVDGEKRQPKDVAAEWIKKKGF
ncbi:MAG: ABC transporter permease/substrate-binding protein [Pyrinomonadaceae bacterium]